MCIYMNGFSVAQPELFHLTFINFPIQNEKSRNFLSVTKKFKSPPLFLLWSQMECSYYYYYYYRKTAKTYKKKKNGLLDINLN